MAVQRWPGMSGLCALLVCVGAAPAVAKKKPSQSASVLAVAEPPGPLPAPWRAERLQLANGLRVVVHTDRSAPIVAVGVLAEVGSRNEQRGQSGLAHFFEHMMFQGTAHTGPMEHVRRIEAQGGTVNAHTSADATFYYQVVPKGALELALWLEADRLAHLRIEAQGVDLQRQAVLAELAERIDNQPGMRAAVELQQRAYATWAMGHPTTGSAADLKAMPLAGFAAFWQRWYAPSGCVLVVSGDVDVATLRPLLEATVALVPPRPRLQPEAIVEPLDATRTEGQVVDPLQQNPTTAVAWKIPAWPHADAAALDLLAHVLGGGPSSRLEQRLVREQPLATAYQAATEGRRDVDLLVIQADLAMSSVKALGDVQQAVWQEVLRIAREGVRPEELRRAQVRLEVAWLQAAAAAERRAELLAEAEVVLGDANRLSELLPRYRAVTPEDVLRVARRWLTWDRATVVHGVPEGWPALRTQTKPRWVAQAEAQIAVDEKVRAARALQAADEAQRKAVEPPKVTAPAVELPAATTATVPAPTPVEPK
jgi:zinc protease